MSESFRERAEVQRKNGKGTGVQMKIVDVSEEPISDEELISIYRWLDTLEFSRPNKTLCHRDFADGVMMAELVAHYIPKIVNARTFIPVSSSAKKKENWERINVTVFRRIRFQLTPALIKEVADARPGMIERVLKPLRLILLRGPKAVAPPSSKLENIKSRFMDIEGHQTRRCRTAEYVPTSHHQDSVPNPNPTATATGPRQTSPHILDLNVSSSTLPTSRSRSRSRSACSRGKAPNSAPPQNPPEDCPPPPSSDTIEESSTSYDIKPVPEHSSSSSRPSTARPTQTESEDTEVKLASKKRSRRPTSKSPRVISCSSSWLPLDLDEENKEIEIEEILTSAPPHRISSSDEGEVDENVEVEGPSHINKSKVKPVAEDDVDNDADDEDQVDDEIFCSDEVEDDDGTQFQHIFNVKDPAQQPNSQQKLKVKRVRKYEFREEYILNGMASFQLPSDSDLENVRETFISPGNGDPNCRGYGFV